VEYKAEWWTQGLPPEGAVQAFASAAVIGVIIRTLLEERLGKGEVTAEDIIGILESGQAGP
jgi:hypothetical protein